MGLRTQLKLQGNEFTNTATAFLIAYLIAEIVNGTFGVIDDLHGIPTNIEVKV
jgi:hypothetical protein